MKLPAYWSRATAEEPNDRGGTTRFACWRWSDVSPEDAHRSALESARRIIRKFVAGEPLDRYGYGAGAIREDVKQKFLDDDGQLAAAITQNAYGSLVLNTARVMFVDIDLPAANPFTWIRHVVGKWFNPARVHPVAAADQQARERIRAFIEQNPTWRARLYRTHSGLRLLVTHQLFEPDGQEASNVFRQLRADPLYVRLCREQQCFRARLTPKPWRCGHRANVVPWPHESEEDTRRFASWQEKYLDRQAGFSTCRFVEELGSGTPHSVVPQVVELHDRLTRCEEQLPLA